MSEQSMYTRFLECLDKHHERYTRYPQRVSMNDYTRLSLMNDMRIPLSLGTGNSRTIMEMNIEVDGSLPDNVIKIDDTIYNNVTARDTQFAGFAKLLLEDMFKVEGRFAIDFTKVDETACERYQLLFAQRAYDLVKYAISRLDAPTLAYFRDMHNRDGMQYVGDMNRWPEKERTRE